MIYPEKSCVVEIKTKRKPVWRTAIFYWNGRTPIFAQYGSDVQDVTEWRYKIDKENEQ